jgi:hypothetical protein
MHEGSEIRTGYGSLSAQNADRIAKQRQAVIVAVKIESHDHTQRAFCSSLTTVLIVDC